VRNLLQIVVSLLSLELRRAGSAGERASLLRMQQRLQSLALAHRRSWGFRTVFHKSAAISAE